MRLIDADALIHRLGAERDEVQIEHACDIGYHNGLNMAVSMTINAPTIDPESLRPQGEWIKWSNDKFIGYGADGKIKYRKTHTYECCFCGRNAAIKSNYCPNCGAKMKGGAE